MTPRVLLNKVYADLMKDRDEKGRKELDDSLYAPLGWDAKSLAKLNAELRGVG